MSPRSHRGRSISSVRAPGAGLRDGRPARPGVGWSRTRARRPAGPCHADPAAEVAMTDLRYKMIMALNAADIGNPICAQAAEICAEIADQHCAELHVTQTAPIIADLTNAPS